MSAMHLNSYFIFLSACRLRDLALAIVGEKPDSSPSFVIGTIVLSTVTTEGFINELGHFASLCDHRELKSCGSALKLLEEEQGKLTVKYLLAGHMLGNPFDPGSNPFQDFQTLVQVRHRLVHLKHVNTLQKGHDDALYHDFPKWIKALQERGLAKGPSRGTLSSWIDCLLTAKMAEWSCLTALNMIRATVDLIPTELAHFFEIFKEDPLHEWRLTSEYPDWSDEPSR